jgi:hypothetical protein
VASGTPAATVVLGDRDLGVRRVVLPLDRAVLAADGQLPAHVGLGLERLATLQESQAVQRTSGATVEVRAVVEHARRLAVDLHRPGLRLAVLVLLDPVALAHRAARVELPHLRGQLGDVRRHALLVVGVGEVGSERAAAGVRGVGVDAGAAAAEDAGVARGQPRQVAPEQLVGIVGIGELHPRTGERQLDFGHRNSLRGR